MKNRTQNVAEKLFSDPFLKNQNWEYLWINSWNFYTVYFHCLPTSGLSKYIEMKWQITCFYLFAFLFLLELVSLPHFLLDFWRKIFLLLYSINQSNFDCLYFLRYWAHVYCNCLLTSLWRHKFWKQPYLLIKPFFLHDQKVKTKISLEPKAIIISLFLKVFHWRK